MRFKKIVKGIVDYLNEPEVRRCSLGDSCDLKCDKIYTAVDGRVYGLNGEVRVYCPKENSLAKAMQLEFYEMNKFLDGGIF